MTKHIDLLRTHQKKDDTKKGAQDTTGSANPYSKTADVAQSASDSHTSLIDENEEVISVTHEPGPRKQLEVSSWLPQISQQLLHIFQSAQQQQTTDLNTVREHLSLLLNQIKQNTNLIDDLELEISRTITKLCEAGVNANDLVQKSIMMMLYTIKVGMQLKLQPQDTLSHTMAAMLHHIGMAMVPDDIRHKAGKLSADELALIKKAPTNAVTYLTSCQADQAMITAIEQAQERFDGSGTLGLSGKQIVWPARIISLLSMFESLIHLRPYRQRLLPRDAIRELVNNHKKAFDPELLRALIESISLYPVGTFVQLNTGEIGQVVTVHSKFPLRPVVHINMDKYGHNITTRKINLKQQPNLMIKKCMYEEGLKEHAQQ